MENLKAACIYLDGVNFFMALFIFLLICVISMFLALFYHIKSKELDRLEMKHKRLHKDYQRACKERDTYSDKYWAADFQLEMVNRELDELRQSQQGKKCPSSDENAEENADV